MTGSRDDVVNKKMEMSLNYGLRWVAVTFWPDIEEVKILLKTLDFLLQRKANFQIRKKVMFTFIGKIQHVTEMKEGEFYRSLQDEGAEERFLTF